VCRKPGWVNRLRGLPRGGFRTIRPDKMVRIWQLIGYERRKTIGVEVSDDMTPPVSYPPRAERL